MGNGDIVLEVEYVRKERKKNAASAPAVGVSHARKWSRAYQRKCATFNVCVESNQTRVKAWLWLSRDFHVAPSESRDSRCVTEEKKLKKKKKPEPSYRGMNDAEENKIRRRRERRKIKKSKRR